MPRARRRLEEKPLERPERIEEKPLERPDKRIERIAEGEERLGQKG